LGADESGYPRILGVPKPNYRRKWRISGDGLARDLVEKLKDFKEHVSGLLVSSRARATVFLASDG
jgi:hypothetical protein